MRIGTARDDIEPAFDQRFGQRLGIIDDRLGVLLEGRLQRLAERRGLAGDHVHQRPTLRPRENRRIDLFREIAVIGHDHATPRAA